MSPASGQCLCGAVSFTVDNVDPEFYACHCKMCLRWCGGPYLAVTATGIKFEDTAHLKLFDSSKWAERSFCSVCGTNIYYHVKGRDTYEINTGTFDDTSPFRMIGEIFVDDKPAGYEFAGDHPRLTGLEAIEKFSFSAD
jgi:hypothetical protein